MGTSNGLLFPTPPRLFQDEVAVALGLNQAIVLQQLVYWENIPKVGVVRDGHKWVYNTYKDWKENFKWWSIRTIQDIFLDLEKQGIVISRQFESASGKMIKFYRVDRDRFDEIMAEKEPLLTHDVNSVSPPPSDAKSVTHDVNSVSCHDANSVRSLKEHRLQEKTENTEESISFRNSTELEKLSSVAQSESVSPIPSKSGLGVVERDQHRALHNVAQAEPVIAQDFATLIAESLPDTPEPVKAKSSKKAASAKSAPPPKPKREPKPPRELDQREAEFLAQVTKLDPFMGKQVESRLRKYRRDKPWSAIQVYLLTGKAVPPASLQAVTSLNGTAFDTELMLKCLSAWVSKGWSPVNLAWLLEWYKAGGPPQYTPRHNAPDAYAPPPKPQALEWEDSPIGKEAIARMAKQKAEKEQEMKGGA